LKKQRPRNQPRNLDKHLFEAGQQCHKRLWLDFHEPVEAEPSPNRQMMAEVGQQLVALARSVFPKGVAVEDDGVDAAASETTKLLDAGTPVVFGATFVADGVQARSDILVRHSDGAVDLYEVKSGTRIKHRYVNDLALQARVVESCGHRVRAAFLLHVNAGYVHKEGADYPPMQLLRSADVTTKVRKQITLVQRRLAQFRHVLGDESALQLPMGTFCTVPFPCPHIERCSKEAPDMPLRELPELTRELEAELHKEGIEDLKAVDPNRSGLTFRQRRTLTCIGQGTPIVEPFVREELRQCTRPLHFIGIAGVTDPLPRFEGQRPWRRVPVAWSTHTVHSDDRVETANFVLVDRTDPRPGFVRSLAKHLEVGGTLMCWDCSDHEELRSLLDDLPELKASVRTIIGRPHVDIMQLFDSGIFHPRLRKHGDLRCSVEALLGDDSGRRLPVYGEDELRAALTKAATPRVRSATKEKIATDVLAAVTWTSERLLELFRKFAGEEAAPPIVKAARPRSAPKPLPNSSDRA
jgi:hypothetical protein